MSLEILYKDEHLVAINKPNGLLVHRSAIARNTDVFAVQLLRNQLQTRVYPIHRLDRKTSGVLLFAKNQKSVAATQACLQSESSQKRYLAIVRGFFPEEILVDYPLKRDDGKVQDAVTLFKNLQHIEINIPFGKFTTSRYSFIEAFPETGRMHQIRKHLNHLRHPIIGDRPHGCNKQNKLFLEKWNMNTMLLHAQQLTFIHPISEEKVIIEADLPEEFHRMITLLKSNSLVNE